MPPPEQQPFGFRIEDQGGFDTFVDAGNELTVASITRAVESRSHEFFYVFGPQNSGKTHFLTAVYRTAKQEGLEASYLDLATIVKVGSEALYHGSPDLNILDNVDLAAGMDDFEMGLFSFYNRWLEGGRGVLVASARCSPDRLPFARHDLNTRMASGVGCPFVPLDEHGCAKALQLKAGKRGFTLNDDVSEFLVSHYNRDMANLTGLLDRLDRASLSEKRHITVRLIKRVLGV